MVGLGMFFIALTLLASFLLWRGRLFETRWLMWVFVFAVLGAVAANQLGWVAAEVGRQPWIVHPPLVRTRTVSRCGTRTASCATRPTEVTLADGTQREMIAGPAHRRRRERGGDVRAGAGLDRAVRR